MGDIDKMLILIFFIIQGIKLSPIHHHNHERDELKRDLRSQGGQINNEEQLQHENKETNQSKEARVDASLLDDSDFESKADEEIQDLGNAKHAKSNVGIVLSELHKIIKTRPELPYEMGWTLYRATVDSFIDDSIDIGKKVMKTKVKDFIPSEQSLSTALCTMLFVAIIARSLLKMCIKIMPFGGPKRTLTRLSLRVFG